MKFRWLVIACAGLAGAAVSLIAVDPALARTKHKHTAKPKCVEQPVQFSLNKFFFSRPPEPNGCAPPVYQYGNYVGQDPDPNIRFQLLRDPDTGYAPIH